MNLCESLFVRFLSAQQRPKSLGCNITACVDTPVSQLRTHRHDAGVSVVRFWFARLSREDNAKDAVAKLNGRLQSNGDG